MAAPMDQRTLILGMGNPLLGIKLKQMLMFKQIPKLIRQTN
jgi:hypothetical protein